MSEEDIDLRAVLKNAQAKELLRPYRYDPIMPPLPEAMGWDFVDAPPEVVRQAYQLTGQPDLLVVRANGQPPPAALLEWAERYGGKLNGGVSGRTSYIRTDTISVPVEHAASLVKDIEAVPPVDDWPEGPLDLAEAWTYDSWDATVPRWAGPAGLITEFLEDPDVKVVGFWWD